MDVTELLDLDGATGGDAADRDAAADERDEGAPVG